MTVAIARSEFRELVDLARAAGYLLRATANVTERFEMRRRGDAIVVCTFDSLEGVRDWLTG